MWHARADYCDVTRTCTCDMNGARAIYVAYMCSNNSWVRRLKAFLRFHDLQADQVGEQSYVCDDYCCFTQKNLIMSTQRGD